MSRIISVHQEHKLLLKLEKAGLNSEIAQKIIDSPENELAQKLICAVLENGYEQSVSQQQARKIMGDNFFGVHEAIKCFGVNPSSQQIAGLTQIPFSANLLIRYRKSHALVAVFSISINELSEKNARLLYQDDPREQWFRNQEFATEPSVSDASWHLIRIDDEDFQFNSNWKKQLEFLRPQDRVPSAQVLIYTILGFYLLSKKEIIPEDKYLRTSSVIHKFDQNQGRVCVSGIGDGLQILNRTDDIRQEDLGLASEIIVV